MTFQSAALGENASGGCTRTGKKYRRENTGPHKPNYPAGVVLGNEVTWYQLSNDVLESIFLNSSINELSNLAMTDRRNRQTVTQVIKTYPISSAMIELSKSKRAKTIFNQLKIKYEPEPPLHLTSKNSPQTMSDIRETLKIYEAQILKYSFLNHFKTDSEEQRLSKIKRFIKRFKWRNKRKIESYIFCLSLKKLAAFGLKDLSDLGWGISNSELMIQAGAIPPLVRLLGSPDSEIAQSGAVALGSLSVNDHCGLLIVQTGAIKTLEEILPSAKPNVQKYAALALCRLTANNDCLVYVDKAGTIEPLVGLLRSADRVMQNYATNALSNLENHGDIKAKIATEKERQR